MARKLTLGALALALVAGIVLVAAPAQASEGWLTSYDDAVAQSKETGKPILIDFTGSDWCGWCIKLKNEVFSKDEFKTWAKENVILLELDFPRSVEQSEELKAQNKKLLEKYKVRGFPTILFVDAEGTVLGKSGYKAGGPEVWVKHAEEVLAAKKAG